MGTSGDSILKQSVSKEESIPKSSLGQKMLQTINAARKIEEEAYKDKKEKEKEAKAVATFATNSSASSFARLNLANRYLIAPP